MEVMGPHRRCAHRISAPARPGPGHRSGAKSGCGDRNRLRRLRRIARRRLRSPRATLTRCCAMATRSFPPCSTRLNKRNRASAWKASFTRTARSATSSPLAFVEAAKRGVTVRIVLDAIGGELSRESQKTLTDAGVMLVWFNTVRPWTLEETNYRTHRKVLVVDGSVAFTGGMGLADHWIGNADAEEHWRDTQIQGHRTRRARARSLVLRKLARVGRQDGARTGSGAVHRRAPGRASLWCGAIPPPA